MLTKINVQDVVSIAKEAGDAIMQIYGQDFEVEYKQDNSPITLADKKANDIIEVGLRKLPVSLPILSEEGREVCYEERRHWEYFWLVDPLDGTKEFIKKNGEFTVNIALIYKDTPVLGVVYAPVLDVCYWAEEEMGAFKDGKKLLLKSKSKSKKYKIVASRSHMSNETQMYIDSINTSRDKVLVSIGSSLKICLVAEGEADIYPRLGPTMEWDTAAAHSIVNESGHKLISSHPSSNLGFLYNKKSLVNKSFIVL